MGQMGGLHVRGAKMEEAIPSPEEFAKDLRAKRYRCMTCAHPAREQIERARENGISYSALAKWTQEFFPEGQRIHETTLTHHFINGHAKHA